MKKYWLYIMLPALFSCQAVAPDTGKQVTETITLPDGNSLFKNNCARCHKVTEVALGPAMRKCYMQRDFKWIHQFLTNRNAVKLDSISKAWKREFKHNCDTFPGLTLEKVEAIGRACFYIY